MEVLLAGSIGALSVFLLGVLKDSLQRVRELRGLARLTSNEIRYNAAILHNYYGRPEMVLTDPTGQLKTLRLDTWVTVRVRLSEMLPVADLGNVSFYYLLLHDLERLNEQGVQSQITKRSAASVLDRLDWFEQSAYAAAQTYADVKFGFLGRYWVKRHAPERPPFWTSEN